MTQVPLKGVCNLLARALYTPGQQTISDAFRNLIFPEGVVAAKLNAMQQAITNEPAAITAESEKIKMDGVGVAVSAANALSQSRVMYPDVMISDIVDLVTFTPSLQTSLLKEKLAKQASTALLQAGRGFLSAISAISSGASEGMPNSVWGNRLWAINGGIGSFLTIDLGFSPLIHLFDSVVNGRSVNINERVSLIGNVPASSSDPKIAFGYMNEPRPQVSAEVETVLARIAERSRLDVFAPVIAARIWTLGNVLGGSTLQAPPTNPGMPMTGAGVTSTTTVDADDSMDAQRRKKGKQGGKK